MTDWLSGLHRDSRRDAARLALQAAVAGVLAYLAARWIGRLDPFLVILMAVGSLHRSVGGTVGEARGRLLAAAAGSALGVLGLLVSPASWGTAAALALVLALVAAAAALRPALALGVVPAVGLTLGGEGALLDNALASLGGIALGVALGVAVSLTVWPDRASARFERHLARALRATAARLADAARAAAGGDPPEDAPAHLDDWNAAVWLAGEARASARASHRDAMARRLAALRGLHDAVVVLDRASEGEAAAEMAAEVDTLRDGACAVLLALAEGRDDAGGLSRADEALSRLARAIAAEDPATDLHARHSAVAFALREVRRSLAELVEAMK